MVDWMAAVDRPLVLVTGSYLGSISHTLTCIDVLARRELAIKALVVNETPGSTVGEELYTNPAVDGLTFTGSYAVGMRIYHNFAKAYPKVTVLGVDPDESSIEMARKNAEEHGVADRVRFEVKDAAGIEASGPFDFEEAA